MSDNARKFLYVFLYLYTLENLKVQKRSERSLYWHL